MCIGFSLIQDENVMIARYVNTTDVRFNRTSWRMSMIHRRKFEDLAQILPFQSSQTFLLEQINNERCIEGELRDITD